MCLGIPGKIITLYEDHGTKMAKIDFGGVHQSACIEIVPEAKPGDWAVVHAGFALSILSENDAQETLAMLREMSNLADQEVKE